MAIYQYYYGKIKPTVSADSKAQRIQSKATQLLGRKNRPRVSLRPAVCSRQMRIIRCLISVFCTVGEAQGVPDAPGSMPPRVSLIAPESEGTRFKTLAHDVATWGGQTVANIVLYSRKEPVYFLKFLFGDDLLEVRPRDGIGKAHVVEHFLDNTYELCALKVEIEGRTPWGGLSKAYKLFYVRRDGSSLQRRLERIAGFAELRHPCSVVSRLELLLQSATPDKQFELQVSDFEFIHEPQPSSKSGGCGFISEEMLKKLLKKNAKVTDINVCIVSPAFGIFKGVLCKKPGISKIQLPASMQKLGPSLDNATSKQQWAWLLITREFPTMDHVQIAKLAKGGMPCRTFKQKDLSKMMKNFLEKSLGVPPRVVRNYTKQKYRKGCLLIGASDPTFPSNLLPAGHIFVSGLSAEQMPVVDGQHKVFVSRYPCVLPEDGRLLPVVTSRPPEMSEGDWRVLTERHFGEVLFSNRGRAIPETISNGDLDGDLYYICWDQSIVQHINTTSSAEAPIGDDSKEPSEKLMPLGDRWLTKARGYLLRNDVEIENKIIARLYGVGYKLAENSSAGLRDADAKAIFKAYHQATDAKEKGNPIAVDLPEHLDTLAGVSNITLKAAEIKIGTRWKALPGRSYKDYFKEGDIGFISEIDITGRIHIRFGANKKGLATSKGRFLNDFELHVEDEQFRERSTSVMNVSGTILKASQDAEASLCLFSHELAIKPSESTSAKAVTWGGQSLSHIVLKGRREPVFFLRWLFGDDLVEVRPKDGVGTVRDMETYGGKTYELCAVKVDKENGRQRWGSPKVVVRMFYVRSDLQGDPLRKKLERIAEFGKLKEACKAASRLELLVSSGYISRQFQLQVADIELIDEPQPSADSGGCGFISEEMLIRLLGKRCNAKQLNDIQVRLVSPALGIFKGILSKKPGISRIQLPPSMRKVGPSTDNTALHGQEQWVWMLVTREFPSTENMQIEEFLKGTKPAKSHDQGVLSQMLQRLMLTLGVPPGTMEYYTKRELRKEAWVVGATDPTFPNNILPAGHIYLSGMDAKHIPLVDGQHKVFITRSPCTLPEDGRLMPVLTSRPPGVSQLDWETFSNRHFGEVIFSNQEYSIPETIAEGDLDGDLYYICWDESIVQHIKNPLANITIEDYSTEPPVKRLPLGDSWLNETRVYMLSPGCSKTKAMIGKLYGAGERVADKTPGGLYDRDARAFFKAYAQAIDAGKHGNTIDLPAHLSSASGNPSSNQALRLRNLSGSPAPKRSVRRKRSNITTSNKTVIPKRRRNMSVGKRSHAQTLESSTQQLPNRASGLVHDDDDGRNFTCDVVGCSHFGENSSELLQPERNKRVKYSTSGASDFPCNVPGCSRIGSEVFTSLSDIDSGQIPATMFLF